MILFLATLLAAQPTFPELRENLEAAQRSYDIDAANHVSEEIGESRALNDPNEESVHLQVESLLLIAELNRIAFEETPENKRSRRKELGSHIDAAAKEGLELVEALADTSEKFRLRADLRGTLIRTKFRAKKHRKKMERDAEHATELDPTNAKAYVTRAKSFLFAGDRHGGDLARAIELLSQALEIDTRLESARLLLALAYDENGDHQAAQTEWERVLQSNPLCTPAERALDHLVEDSL